MADAAPADEQTPEENQTASVVGLLLEPLPTITRAEGVRVVVEGHPEIEPVFSNSDGVYRIPDVPINTEVVVRCEKDGFFPAVSRVFDTGVGEYSMDIMFMIDAASVPLLMDIAGVEQETGVGQIMGMVSNSADSAPMAGISVATTPMAGEYRYSAETGFIDPQLEATTAHGAFVVWNLAPGDYEFTGGSTTEHSCRATGDGNSAPTVRVYADTISHAWLVCD